MLMILDSSIESLELQNDINSCSAIENLLGAVFSGCHILTGSTTTLDFLLQHKIHFSSRSQAVLREVRNNIPQYGGLFANLKTRANVCADIPTTVHISERQWNIPLHTFIDISAVNKPVLLAEDQVDAEIYYFAAEHFKVMNKIRGVMTAFRPDGGGGSRTVRKFNNIANQEIDMCLCITDSDRFIKNADANQTSKDCAKIAEDSAWVVRHRCTAARELENLLPHRFIDRTIESRDNQQYETWERIKEKFQADEDLCSHVDLKDGTCLGWVLKLHEQSPSRKYWMTVASKLGVNQTNCTCMNAQKCGANNIQCDCQLILGMGTKLSEMVLEWLNVTSRHKSLECLDATTDTEWLQIGEEVFEWCCAWEPMRC